MVPGLLVCISKNPPLSPELEGGEGTAAWVGMWRLCHWIRSVGQGGVSTGSMQGVERGEEERGEASEKGSGEEQKKKQRAGAGKRDGEEGTVREAQRVGSGKAMHYTQHQILHLILTVESPSL